MRKALIAKQAGAAVVHSCWQAIVVAQGARHPEKHQEYKYGRANAMEGKQFFC